MIGCLSVLVLFVVLGAFFIVTAQKVLAFGSAISTQSPLSTQTGYMNTSDRVNILIMGYGGAGHDGAYLTDSLVVMSLIPSTNHTTLISVPRADAVRIVTVALAFPLVMLALSPAIGFAMHEARAGSEAHSSLLAGPVERLWRDTTDTPLQLFSSTEMLVDGVPFYLHDHPISVHVLERAATAQENARIEKEGVALLCPMSAQGCIAAAQARAERSPLSNRMEIEVSRRYLGNKAAPAAVGL